MKRITSSSAVVITFLMAVSIAAAQVATGTPKFSSIAGGPDSINLGNLNIHFEVPVLNKAGRGIPFTYILSYDSSVWYPSSPGSGSWTAVPNLGWRGQTEMATGYLSYKNSSVRCPGTTISQGSFIFRFSGFVYHDAWGIPHHFTGTASDASDCPSPYITPVDTGASDGSGYHLNFLDQNGPTSDFVTSKTGEVIYPAENDPNGSSTATDANGNQISVAGNGTFTDTLGLPVLTVTGSAPNPVSFTYKDTSGNNQSVVVHYTAETVKTNFGCTGIAEYGPTAVNLITSISMPDGSSYQFTYEATPGYSGDVTGRVASIQLATGGTISYTYTGSNNGVDCSDGSTVGFERYTPDTGNNYWSYSRSGSGNSWTTSVTDPAGNQTAITFQKDSTANTQNYYETRREINQGASTLLKTIYTCYNGAAPDCSSTSVSSPITETSVTTKLDNAVESKVDTFYNGSGSGTGLVSEVDEYDFGNPSPGGLLRKTLTTYASLGNGIIGRPSSVQILDGNGTQVAYTTYRYDETALASTSGVPQHVGISGSRGNLTTISQWLNTTNSYLSTTMAYDDTGNVVSTTDPGGHTTSIQYVNADAFPGTVTMPDTNSPNLAHHTTSATYDSNTGLVTVLTDQNANQTHYYYSDTLLRPTEIDYPDGGATTYTYVNPNEVETRHKVDSSNWTDQYAQTDGLGRPIRTALWNAAANNYYDESVVCYDALGRLSYQAYMFQDNGWSWQPNCNFSGDHFYYDALSRPTQTQHSDGSSVNYSYTGRATQVQDEGNGSYNVTRVLQNDALGRLAYVCEVSGGTLLGSGGTPSACGLDIGATGFLTSYGYNTLDKLTSTNQGGYAGRSYGYDSLSRMTSESFPEQFGCTTNYSYNNDSLLSTRTRPAPNQGSCTATVTTTYTYDELHRLRNTSYSDGTTPTATYNYDEANTWGWATTNAIGRLTTASVSNAGDIFPGADAMGRITHNGKCTPRTCGSTGYDHYYTYNYVGEITSFNNTGLYTLTDSYNGAGLLNAVTSSLVDAQHPATIINNIVYGAFGITSDTMGNGVVENFGYSTRGAPSSYSAGSVYSFSLVTCPPEIRPA